MASNPPIPNEQRSFADKGGGPDEVSDKDEATEDRRDQKTDAQSGQPGDADVNTDTQGRFGNLKQNIVNRWNVQDR
jgi:hypothetical protein